MSSFTSTMQRFSLLLVVGASFGCASSPPPPQAMTSGASVPASEGTVDATDAKNGNTNVALRVKHLASPSKVAPDAVVYVVWIQPRNAEPQSVGAMVVNDDLEGRLETVTPHRRFRVLVTPEPSGQVSQPTHAPVFTAEVDRAD